MRRHVLTEGGGGLQHRGEQLRQVPGLVRRVTADLRAA
jgi:hypothetical protein